MLPLPRRLCVIAAHPDDDAIGCGGLLAQAAVAASEILVIYLSDGRASHPNSLRYPPEAVAQLRSTEALAALRELGVVSEPSFFALPDGELATLSLESRRSTVTRLATLLTAFAPDLVAAPWRRDPHPDHVAAASITADALRECNSPAASVGYEVWLRIRGKEEDFPTAGEAIPIIIALQPADIGRKRAAILAHTSQTTTLIDDDPNGFRIDTHLLDKWLTPEERFYLYPGG